MNSRVRWHFDASEPGCKGRQVEVHRADQGMGEVKVGKEESSWGQTKVLVECYSGTIADDRSGYRY
jgi:hypothetical protein